MSEVRTSPRGVFGALIASVVLALVALVTFVLPAEYGIDPLGVGEALGVKGMSGYTVSALSVEEHTYYEDSVSFPLAPFESVEYKYHLDAGQSMVYSWQAEGEVVFDFHGHGEEEGADAEHAEYAEEDEDAVSFSVGRDSGQHGTYVAPFSGLHGWFWENRTQQEVTVRLQTRGFYHAASTFSSAGEHVREFTP